MTLGTAAAIYLRLASGFFIALGTEKSQDGPRSTRTVRIFAVGIRFVRGSHSETIA